VSAKQKDGKPNAAGKRRTPKTKTEVQAKAKTASKASRTSSSRSKKTRAAAGATTRKKAAATDRRTRVAAERRSRGASAKKAGGPEEDPNYSEEQELGIGSRVIPPQVEYEEARVTKGKGKARKPKPEDELDVEAQIRALEERLDGLIRGATTDPASEPSLREQMQDVAQRVVGKLNVPLERPGGDEGGVGGAMRELMSSDYYLRQWGRMGMRSRSEEVDDFGLDPAYEARLKPLLDFLYQRYFRIDTEGVHHVPEGGRCLVVANHSGVLPLDGLMLRTALRLEHATHRELRWLAEDFIYYLPFLGAFMNRVGAVRACQENAERLLRKDSLVAVFPEGVKGIGKLYRERYRLQRFGRGGFIRLALRTRTPIVPCGIIGAEEATPMLYRLEYLTKAVGLPYIPVTPTFPALGPLGLMPAPTKWRIQFGEPMHFDAYGPDAADDQVLVGRLAERVRASIQRMVDEGLARRQSVWLG